MCDLSSREAKTFRITSVINFKDCRKPMKVRGLVSGMCKEHALEKTRATMHQLGRTIDGAKNFRIAKVKYMKNDWMIVPKNGDNFEDFLKDKRNEEINVDDFSDKLRQGFIAFLKRKAEAECNPLAKGLAEALESTIDQTQGPEKVLSKFESKIAQARDIARERKNVETAKEEVTYKADINMNDAPDGIQSEEVETKVGE